MRKIKLQPSLVISGPTTFDFAHRYDGLRMVAPILALGGMSLSLLAVRVADVAPGLSLDIVAVLVSFMVLAALLAIAAPLFRQDVVRLTVDERRRIVHIVTRGPLADATWTRPLSALATARMELSYDRRGTKSVAALLQMRDGRSLRLPDGTSFCDVEALRGVIARHAPPLPAPARHRSAEEAARARHAARQGAQG